MNAGFRNNPEQKQKYGKNKMKQWIKITFASLLLTTILTCPSHGEELLINRDFEIGTPEMDKPPVFNCKGWRRELWAENEYNAWLTDGSLDREIGKNNQALQFRWGATSIYQYFSALPGENYSFSVAFYNAGTADNRWQPRIQAEWFDASGRRISETVTVAEANNAAAPVKIWNTLSGAAVAPAGTAYARVMLNVNNKGEGNYWQATFLDNASVTGKKGTNNLPVSFANHPYGIALNAIPESTPWADSLNRYADDKDGDALKFTKLAGPAWINISEDGKMTGTPTFSDAGDNVLTLQVDDGNGHTDTCVFTLPVIGSFRLGNLFSDNMVLQRDLPVPVWGKALPNTPVTVFLDGGKTVRTESNADGDWSLMLPPMPASERPVALQLASGERTFRLNNLLVGDVWFCSGQSNMDWPLKNTDGSAVEIASANHPSLRLVKTPQTQAASPWNNLEVRAKWAVSSTKTVEDFSAVAYYFGKYLQQDLDIPIGLIQSAQGGTSIEKWAATLEKPGTDTFYNSRVHPYTRMPIKGAIWYQAEANIADGSAYTAKMQTLVKDWRTAWAQGDFPFYFVQLAPFNYSGDAIYQLPEIWAAQTRAMETIPNTGMAVINDIGTMNNIHPQNKAPVGERLALWALYGTYGRTNLVHMGPMVRSVKREGANLRVLFNHAGSGLVTRDGNPPDWFEVAGSDQIFSAATAAIEGDTVLVIAPSVNEPEWVRFAWHETAAPNLMNKERLPANSFARKMEP